MRPVRNTLLVAVAVVLAAVPAAQARTYEVNARNDAKPNGCTAEDCTLREAVIAANAHRGADTIVLLGAPRPAGSTPQLGGVQWPPLWR